MTDESYLRELLKLAEGKRGQVLAVVVEHDDWCPMAGNRASSGCICNPNVKQVSVNEWGQQVIALNRAERRRREREAQRATKKGHAP